jgi:hypothetical protein
MSINFLFMIIVLSFKIIHFNSKIILFIFHLNFRFKIHLFKLGLVFIVHLLKNLIFKLLTSNLNF